MLNNNNYIQLLVSNNCLNLVLNNFKDNKGALFSCLLVNRLFCQHVIPYLWSSPFDLETTLDKHKLILRTYISCLHEEEKRQLTNFKVELERLPTPKINYPTYVKIFSNQQIQDAVEKFISTEQEAEEKDHAIKVRILLCKIITNLLIDRTKGFTNMEMIRNSSSLINTDFIIFPKLSQALSKLHGFEFVGEFSQEICQLFTSFSQRINTIQKLSILFQSRYGQEITPEITQAITKLIKSQTKLISFTIAQYWDNDDWSCSEIYSAINSQSNSLKILRIEGLTDIQQLLIVLQNCKNLENLQLWELGEIDSDSLLVSKYPGFTIKSIKNLYCDGYNPNLSALTTVELFLRICDPSLRMLWLSHVTKEILTDIGCYFPNLSYLSLKIYEDELPYLLRLLPQFKLLEHFTLSIISDLHDNNLFNTNALDLTTSSILLFAKAIPETLRYFGIDFIMNERDFEFFFGNLRVPLKQLAILENSIIYDYVLTAILKYADRVGSLEELIYDQSYDDGEYFSEKMLEEARTLIPKIRFFKRGKSSTSRNYFDIQCYEESRRN